MSTSLLPNEQIAADFVTKIGIERAKNILSKISKRFDRRYEKACENSFVSLNRSAIRVTEIEAYLSYRIRLGLMICDTYDTPAAARQRNLERRAKRRAERNL